ncbi:MAG: hypothetical protein WKG01_01725 [Kofleriaceae bacterium]
MDDDPAKHRVLLIYDRSEARGAIFVGLVLVLSAVPVLMLSVWTNDIVLLLGTLYLPAALGFGVRALLGGIARYSVASFNLRHLHNRPTGLPAARLVE